MDHELLAEGLGWAGGTDGPARRADLLRGELPQPGQRLGARPGREPLRLHRRRPRTRACSARAASMYVCQNGGTVGPWRAEEMSVPSIQRIDREGGRGGDHRDRARRQALQRPQRPRLRPGRAPLLHGPRARTGRPTRSRRTCSCSRRTAAAGCSPSSTPPTFPNGIAIEADGSVVWAESYTGMVRRLRLDTGAIEDIARLPGREAGRRRHGRGRRRRGST